MMNSEQLAGALAIESVRTWVRVMEHAHAQGIDSVLIPGVKSAMKPRQARVHFLKLLNDRRLRDVESAAPLQKSSGNPENWPAKRTRELWFDVERVETLAWVASLRRSLPGWGGSTPMPQSWAWQLVTTPMDEWWPRVRVRSHAVVENATRQAAAWQWRAYADVYRGFLKDDRKVMRVFARAVVDLVPEATAIAKKEGWFTPEHGDFPLGANKLIYGFLDMFDREELYVVASARCSALRKALEHRTSGAKLSVAEAWQVMIGDDVKSSHPAWPF